MVCLGACLDACVLHLCSMMHQMSHCVFAHGRRAVICSVCGAPGLSALLETLPPALCRCLGLFLLVVHYRGLEWDYTSEVLVTVGATLIVGIFGARKTTFKSVWAVPNLLLFPLSILCVWYFDYVLHLDG